ncbi:MAG: hypothetical protein IJA72_04890 [Clostridia bacterium]|nr:hypothetical protein [Clostridia bacterium]
MWDAEERVSCQDCIWHRWDFKVDDYLKNSPYANRIGCGRRIDHTHVRRYQPSFVNCYDCDLGFGRVCSDFQPSKSRKYVYDHWEDFDTYIEGYKTTWGKHGNNFWTGYVWVYLNNHLYDSFDAPIYAIDAHELVYGHPYNFTTGQLNAKKKKWQERRRNKDKFPLGFETLCIDIDGINVFDELRKEQNGKESN